MARRIIRTNSLANYYLNEGNIERAIKNRVKKEKGIIYGAQSIKKQLPLFARRTEDYDIFVNKPRRVANKVEREVEGFAPGDDFFVKKGVNPGTWKLKHKGADMKKETQDDISVADFTKMPKPQPKFKVFGGIRYRVIREELAAKKKILRDKQFAFRHKKDREDLNRLNLGRRFL